MDGSVQNQSGASVAISSGPQQHMIQQLEQCKYLPEIALIIETGASYGQGRYFMLVVVCVGCCWLSKCLYCNLSVDLLL